VLKPAAEQAERLEISTWGMFRYPPNSKFFHSLSVTSIFGYMYEALNVDKKITNCTVW
jgi:hypothetical protein